MQERNQHQNNGNGFLFGVIVGVLVTLLFTTKRGREILKEVTDKGIKKWSELEKLSKEMQEETFGEDEMDDESSDYVAPEKKEVRYIAAEPVAHEKKVVAEAPVEKKAPKAEVVEEKSEVKAKEAVAPEEKKSSEKTITGRRWFRGLRKRG